MAGLTDRWPGGQRGTHIGELAHGIGLHGDVVLLQLLLDLINALGDILGLEEEHGQPTKDPPMDSRRVLEQRELPQEDRCWGSRTLSSATGSAGLPIPIVLPRENAPVLFYFVFVEFWAGGGHIW